MSTKRATTQQAVFVMPDSFDFDIEKPENYSTVDESGEGITPQKFTGGYVNPSCEHNWFKLADDLQTLASEGKTVWQCSNCAEVTNTYNWQAP